MLCTVVVKSVDLYYGSSIASTVLVVGYIILVQRNLIVSKTNWTKSHVLYEAQADQYLPDRFFPPVMFMFTRIVPCWARRVQSLLELDSIWSSLVLMGSPVVDMILEAYGFIVLFSGYAGVMGRSAIPCEFLGVVGMGDREPVEAGGQAVSGWPTGSSTPSRLMEMVAELILYAELFTDRNGEGAFKECIPHDVLLC